MCLAIPGKIVTIKEPDTAALPGKLAQVDFQGSRIEVSLAMVPEARQGDWILVHAGYALNVLDEQEAKETWDYLQEAGVDVELPKEQN